MEPVHGLVPILRATANACRTSLSSSGTYIVLVDRGAGSLLAAHRSGEDCPDFPDYRTLSESPLYNAIRTDSTEVIPDPSGTMVSISTPIRIRSEPSGLLSICLSNQDGAVSRETISVAEALAAQCGATLRELHSLRLHGLEDVILDSLFQNAPEAVVLLDESNRVVRINDEFTRLFGYEAEEVKGEHIDDLIAPPEHYLEAETYSRRAEGGEKFSAETVRRRKDGSLVEVSLLGAPIEVEGEIAGIFGIYRDISVRKRMERELAESENRYRQIFENAPIGIFQTHSRGYFLKLNRATAAIFGYDSVEDFMSRVHDLASDIYADPGKRGEYLAVLQTQREVTNYVIEAKKKDGSRVTISINSRISSVENDDFVIDGFIVDLTELKRTERQLTRSLKEKEVLLKELHHRVKNNMQIISSLLRMEADTFAGEHEAASRILRISQNRIRSMSLIHEKLYDSSDLTRIELAEYSRDLCREVLDMALIRPLPEAHFDMDAVDADIDFAIPYGLILNELLLNATKHAFAGISEPRLSVTLTLNGESLILDVQDNGSGLPPDFREKRRRSLGMQLIDSLVEQLGGSISFSSEGGTRCTIEFPSLNEANPAGQTSR